jgi:hypothetical protein
MCKEDKAPHDIEDHKREGNLSAHFVAFHMFVHNYIIALAYTGQ